MPETVSDTGPILHLQEIGKLPLLSLLSPLLVPDLVAAELEARELKVELIREAAVQLTVAEVQPSEWREVIRDIAPQIQPADAQVFVLVRQRRFQTLALTDDLNLRRLLENHGAPVVGTVGILVRAYTAGKISHTDLEISVDALFSRSSLFISRAFRSYLKDLISRLAY